MKFSFRTFLPKKLTAHKKKRVTTWRDRIRLWWMVSTLAVTVLLVVVFIFSAMLFYRIQNNAIFVADQLEVGTQARTIDRNQLEEVVSEIEQRELLFSAGGEVVRTLVDPSQ